MTFNLNRDSKKTKALSPDDFMPAEFATAKPPPMKTDKSRKIERAEFLRLAYLSHAPAEVRQMVEDLERLVDAQRVEVTELRATVSELKRREKP